MPRENPAFSLGVFEPEKNQQGDPNDPDPPAVGDKVGVCHQSDANGAGLPEFEVFSIAVGAPADGAENEAGEQIVGFEMEHAIRVRVTNSARNAS